MREIRFRIWDTKTKRYLEKGHPDFVNAWGFEDCKNRLALKAKSGSLIFEQYTGFKDQNGVDIYEGDIIWLFGIHLEVIWSQDEGKFDIRNKDFRAGAFIFDKHTVQHIEVIGNIHENPELLEAKL